MKMVGNKKKSAALMTALKGVGSPNVHMLPEKKEPKGRSMGMVSEGSYYDRPTIWLSDKDFPGVENFKGGEKIVLAVECMVERVSVNENMDDKGKTKKSTEARLEICAISDITGGKK